jgi:glycosyltransferase involved in cell wall biosynthesis
MIGDGPLMNEVKGDIQSLGMDNCAHCLGWQDDADRIIAIADILSLTSRWEGLPYVLLEAMAWSRPVVATNVNGCSEVINDGVSGYLVPHDDPKSWSKAVVELLEDANKSAEMGYRGNKKLAAEFSLDKTIGKIEQLYDSFTL